MSATIRDVARRAGVGLGTVSRVLNNSPLVSDATRQRVLDVIAELDYAPSHVARNLSLGRTQTIAAIAPFFTRPSVVERLRGAEATLAGSPYDLVVFNVESVERRNSCLQTVPRRDRYDGLLLISLAPQPAEVAAMRSAGVPVVVIDKTVPDLPCVTIDDQAGGHMATYHLINLGHRRIAYLSDPLRDPLNFEFTSSQDRYLGYRKALANAGISFRDDYHVSGPHDRYEARVLAQRLLAMDEPPTAIFAASDTQAMGVLEAARDCRLRVPHDLSVIGFDDIDVAAYLNLTTIRQPLFETGARGVEMLLTMLENPDRTHSNERLPVSLVVRGTTAPVAG
ncbi:MAG: LacI family transcriptional regulator [Chloroflexaceae bacterium]|nr:LacI family transcriptional regulator [Chloroflexaceae bacterium]